ncbi:nucleotidyl transferase AbiEii/AbiGii toxin family protein [Taibaiella chishuiensis]|uniref:Nucleotidyltransferase AbiEii toxin of type IV toxin-antitoxin system n=1 Tax=Taibaiella chishuiensis TaxID=1434707 RepID=A0A2P8D647_9BACT|nr:nucleotidyl transferase AbiEii/AbiGii toxin family protein [Taibaiella chishuiensis]PSK92693.1 nucleotidyltransferase AbiEii toxin of type IV toxin-antitoxin system [Taibaiella chishuiensis]
MMTDEEIQLMIAYEGFIRRSAATGLPFMLKGSYVTRQYFPANVPRIPGDLDWLCLDRFPDEETARTQLDAWATAVTRLAFDDGVRFRDFKENEFWRRIDYAMDDDFPTVNTDLKCWVADQELEFPMDVSFNLPIDLAPVPLLYKPLQGEPFTIPFSTPLALQVAWKIHQTLVRPRFKDLLDLLYLVQHKDFTPTTLQQSFAALLAECKADKTDLWKIKTFLSYKLGPLFAPHDMQAVWKQWRHYVYRPFSGNGIVIPYNDRAEHLTDINLLPEKLDDFITLFRNAMEQAGFTPGLAAGIPDMRRQEPPPVPPAMPTPATKQSTTEQPEQEQPATERPVTQQPGEKTSLLQKIRRFFQ